MKRTILVLLALAGCSDRKAEAPQPEASATPAAAAGLTGLYESAAAQGAKSQMCIVDKGGAARFGLVVWGANQHSCSGTGSATRTGDTLRLAMTGDSDCAIDARIVGGTVTLPDAIPDGCAYYCGARADMAGVAFARAGATAADALKAKDLVGESLCQGM